jgi:hypothetical protein
MYEIILNNEILALVSKPRYIRIKPSSGAYIEANLSNAEGVAVNGTPYNLEGFNICDNGTVEVHEIDEYEYILTNQKATAANIETLENAICDLDEAINGGK